MTKIAVEDIFKALDDAIERDKIVVAALLFYRAAGARPSTLAPSGLSHLWYVIQNYLDDRFGSVSAASDYLNSLDE